SHQRPALHGVGGPRLVERAEEDPPMRSIEILERLIAFPTVSRDPNRALIDYAADLLTAIGADVTILPDESGGKANLFATIGPAGRPAVMLSGHTDVVPVEGQAWTVDPFRLTRRDGRLYGRGTADMKGFVAASLAAAEQAAKRDLATPLQIALSFDEEIGCVGVKSLVDMVAAAPVRPAFCIVGEPTALAVATGHKGKTGLRTVAKGREGHSALAPMALNAIHLATDLIGAIRAKQAEIEASGARDGDYDVPYTTLHVGKLEAGVALNIVPNRAEMLWEIRNLADDDPLAILAELETAAAEIVAATGDGDAALESEIFNAYPGLATPPDAAVTAFVKSLTGANGTIKVAFGTEGGLFSAEAGVPTVVCGPGSMAQGHKPDEYVEEAQLEACDAMLGRLIDRLAEGI
ncbi:MAG: acetylornithine deacetylase, partial [Pseudomonadota bacterium]